MSTFTTSIQYSIRSPSQRISQEKEIKGTQIWKEVKLFLFTDDIISYVKTLKKIVFTVRSSKFSTVAG